MMDRYLFRGKRLDNSKWVQGDLLTRPDGTPFGIRHYNNFGVDCAEIDPATVGQCTGLKDKNGKLIFEGDIAKGSYEETDGRIVDYFEEVKYITDQGGWVLGDEDAFNNLDGISAQEVEVVGNAHDNPELLEGGGERWIKS